MLSCIAAFGCEKPSIPPAVATVNGEAISLAEFEKSLTEEIALKMGYLTREDVRRIGESMHRNEYGQYLLRLVRDR